MAATPLVRRTPEPPPAYRPQSAPKVLQAKTAQAHPYPLKPRTDKTPSVAPRLPSARQPPPPVSTPPRVKAVQPKPNNNGAGLVVAAARPLVQRAAVQRFKSGVVQAVKFYPNLHPGAAVPVDRSNIFTLDNFADQYRLHRIHSHSVNVPNMKYNFVRTREGQTLLHNRYRHPSLAEGQQVLYAGEVFFNNGKLQWWSNGSGHYQPDADGAEQASLPMDYFYSYQQIIKGEHLRRRGAPDSGSQQP